MDFRVTPFQKGLCLGDKNNLTVTVPESVSSPLKLQGPVVQSIVNLMGSLVVKLLSVLVIRISDSQVFLLKKCVLLLQMQKLLTIFSAKILAYMSYLMIKVLAIR